MATSVLLGTQFIAAQKIDSQDLVPFAKHTLDFAQVDGQTLKLDLYLPKEQASLAPLLVYVHGGAWRAGSREGLPLLEFLNHGWAIASVDYRLSGDAKFPAQVHDIKAAIRFLRAQEGTHGYDTKSIVISGSSAGGHLAALVGVTNGHEALEGEVGDYGDADSSVQAIVSFYGASNLTTILSQSTPHGLSVRVPALELFLGGLPEDQLGQATLASPVVHVDAQDPPLLLLHGDQDPQMPINQSHELEGAYNNVGASVRFEVVHGGAHGGEKFYTSAQMERVVAFCNRIVGKIEAHKTDVDR